MIGLWESSSRRDKNCHPERSEGSAVSARRECRFLASLGMTNLTFALQPHLVGELLELRPLKPEDWESLFAAASDPLIWEQHPASDRYQERVFMEFFREALESGGALVVIDRATHKIIGSSRYFG